MNEPIAVSEGAALAILGLIFLVGAFAAVWQWIRISARRRGRRKRK